MLDVFDRKLGFLQPCWGDRTRCFLQDLGTFARHVGGNRKEIYFWWEVGGISGHFLTTRPDVYNKCLRRCLRRQKMDNFAGRRDISNHVGATKLGVFNYTLEKLPDMFIMMGVQDISRGILWRRMLDILDRKSGRLFKIFDGKFKQLQPCWGNRSTSFYQDLGTTSRHVCGNEEQILWREFRTFPEVFCGDKRWRFLMGSLDISGRFGITEAGVFIKNLGWLLWWEFRTFLEVFWSHKGWIFWTGSWDISSQS